jgi:DNA mismatch repair protein MutL
MGRINILPPSVFNRIAAGEVVDRPYSVVKELVENAIDAGATEIEIQIEKGGKRYISVRDNGEGIDYADLKSLYLPHATSKISSAVDLENIRTLGFRGEAVASVASVSRMRYTSEREGADSYRIECNGGDLGEIEQTASIGRGTLAEVQDLFFNTPVRLKFLKSDKAEESDISTFVNRFMLSHPHIAFTYYIDKRLAAKSLGEGEDVVMAAVYGPAILANTYRIHGVKNGIVVSGYIGNQNFFKSNRSYQSVFLNGRFIVNTTISAALTNAYANYAMKRQYPFYVLYLTIPPEVVDVNVHPNKADVRFADNQVVYSAIYGIVSAVLDGSPKGLEYTVIGKEAASVAASQPKVPPIVREEELPKETVETSPEELPKGSTETLPKTLPEGLPKDKDFTENTTTEGITEDTTENPTEEPAKDPLDDPSKWPRTIRNLYIRVKPQVEPPQYDFEDVREELRQADLENWRKKNKPKRLKPSSALKKEYPELFFHENSMSVHGEEEEKNDFFAENKRLLNEMQAKEQERIDIENCEFKGSLFNTYLLYEQGDKVYLVDQHAAHERLLYNRLQERIKNREVVQQPMLVPYEVHLTPTEDIYLFDCLPALREMGFDIDENGMNRFIIRAVPADLQSISLDEFFRQFLRDLSGLQKIKLSTILKDKLAMMACKAAVKGGMHLTDEEAKQLILDMNGDTTLKCPHGRPVVAVVTKYELEKMFKRIV